MDCSVWMTGNVATPVTFRSGASANGQKWARADFRLACTRRTRQPDGQWGDAGTTFITVVAWRALAEGVFGSIEKGDPVVVCGRLATDEWVDKNGELQSRLTLAAESVGHDLSRGRARFSKNPAAPATQPDQDAPEAPLDAEAAGEAPRDDPEAEDGYALLDEFDPRRVG